MEDMVGLTLACLNIKKLVKMMVGKTYYLIQIPQYYWIVRELSVNIKKANIVFDVCLHSEGKLYRVLFFRNELDLIFLFMYINIKGVKL